MSCLRSVRTVCSPTFEQRIGHSAEEVNTTDALHLSEELGRIEKVAHELGHVLHLSIALLLLDDLLRTKEESEKAMFDPLDATDLLLRRSAIGRPRVAALGVVAAV